MRPTPAHLNISSKPPRKVVPLTAPQAWSRLFCPQRSELYKELHAAWKLWVSGDEATIESYKHLLSTKHNPKLPFVTFQQAVLKEKLETATEEELKAIQEYIDTRFQEETELRVNPWQALKVDDIQSELDLEKQYLQE